MQNNSCLRNRPFHDTNIKFSTDKYVELIVQIVPCIILHVCIVTVIQVSHIIFVLHLFTVLFYKASMFRIFAGYTNALSWLSTMPLISL